MKRFLTIICFSLSISYSFAQQEVLPYAVNAKMGYGVLMPHRSIMQHLVTGHAQLVELSFDFKSYGQHNFDHHYLLPNAGVSALYFNSGNAEVIGNCFGLYSYFTLPLSRVKFIPKLRMGGGFGYVEKPFDALDNQNNNAIGSHLNVCLLVELTNEVNITNNIDWVYGLSLTHFSNGSFAQPNLGLNFATLNTGIKYSFGDAKTVIAANDYALDKSIKWLAFVYGGLKSNSTHYPEKHPVVSLSAEGNKRLTYKSMLLFGADIYYNSSIEHMDEYNHLEENVDYLKPNSNFQSGVFFGYGLVFDRLMISIQNGIYAYNLEKERGIFYHRVSVRRNFKDKWIANIGLKSHFAVAEYLEFGVGYKF